MIKFLQSTQNSTSLQQMLHAHYFSVSVTILLCEVTPVQFSFLWPMKNELGQKRPKSRLSKPCNQMKTGQASSAKPNQTKIGGRVSFDTVGRRRADYRCPANMEDVHLPGHHREKQSKLFPQMQHKFKERLQDQYFFGFPTVLRIVPCQNKRYDKYFLFDMDFLKNFYFLLFFLTSPIYSINIY